MSSYSQNIRTYNIRSGWGGAGWGGGGTGGGGGDYRLNLLSNTIFIKSSTLKNTSFTNRI